MRIPPGKMTVVQFNQWLRDERDRLYHLDGVNLYCKKCHTPTNEVVCHVTIHYVEFGQDCVSDVAGGEIALQYCPRCEARPSDPSGIISTCVHVGTFTSHLKPLFILAPRRKILGIF